MMQTPMELSQKNVVYIGGCGGIGSATCRLLVQKKVANLAILDLVKNDKLIEDLVTPNSSTNVFFLKVDVRCKENVKKCLDEIVSKINHIDILVNGSGLFNEIDAEITIGVNLLGLIHGTMAAMELMDKSKGNRGGLILNIASGAGLEPFGPAPIYSASKAGIVMFTRSWAEGSNFVKSGVSLITICPGLTTTPLLNQITDQNLSSRSADLLQLLNSLSDRTPEECAKSMVEAIEINKNGAVYICDLGQIKEVVYPKLWDPQT